MALLVSDWLQIGLNLAISELYPVFSSRCTYQVCYILRKTPRASSKKIFLKLSRWGKQLFIISGILAVNPNVDLACFRGISGKTCPKQARGLCLRRSTFVCAAPSLLFTAPSLTSTTLFRCGLASCCKHLEQLSECLYNLQNYISSRAGDASIKKCLFWDLRTERRSWNLLWKRLLSSRWPR